MAEKGYIYHGDRLVEFEIRGRKGSYWTDGDDLEDDWDEEEGEDELEAAALDNEYEKVAVQWT